MITKPLSTLFIALLLTGAAVAATPRTLNYQGFLKNADGTPVAVSTKVVFSLYSSNPARDNPVWRESRNVTPVNGIYSLQLGAETPLAAPFDVPYLLGIQVGGEAEMALQPLSGAPYALRAAVADSVASGGIADAGVTTAKLADGAVTPAKIGGTLPDSKLTTNVMLLDSAQTVTGAKTFMPSSGAAPFSVDATKTGLVANLNAEMVGGKKLAELAQYSPAQVPRANIITTLDSAGNVGQDNSITIGADGLPVISYYDATHTDLKVAKCANTACSGTPTITTLDNVGAVGQCTSIAIGADGLPVISYHSPSHYGPKVAKCVDAACSGAPTVTTLESVQGIFTSIAIGTDGLPVFSYFDGSNNVLKVAKCANAACSGTPTITILDSAARVGYYSSITIGTDSLPVISYYDTTNGNLKVAKCANAACSGTPTITTLGKGGETSITIGADGLPVISYHDGTNGDLKVAKCVNAACNGTPTITTLDSAGNVGGYPSITIGADGLPVISYYDVTNKTLKVAKCANAACSGTPTITTLDSAGDVGEFSSITIGADGLPIISYYDATNKTLKVAKCANQFCLNNWSRR